MIQLMDGQPIMLNRGPNRELFFNNTFLVNSISICRHACLNMVAGDNGPSKVSFCAIAEMVVCIFNLGLKNTRLKGLILDRTMSLCWIVVCKLNLQCNARIMIVYLIIMGDVMLVFVHYQGILYQWMGKEGWWRNQRLIVFITMVFFLEPLFVLDLSLQ